MMSIKKTFPKISVVTIVYNDVNNIEATILSVLLQDYPNIEYIVIDGGSTDGTVNIIEKYSNKIRYWISERDNGIYDAMNKGIKQATGEWINFMNSGDRFYNKNSISDVFKKCLSDSVDVVYGYQIHNFSYGQYVRKRIDLSFFSSLMPIGHASSFVKMDIMKEYMFDTSFKVAADYNFFYNLFITDHKFYFVEVIVSVFEASNGISSKNEILTLKETSIINGSYKSFSYYMKIISVILRSYIKRLISVINPKINLVVKRRKRNNNIEYIQLKTFLNNIYAKDFDNNSSI